MKTSLIRMKMKGETHFSYEWFRIKIDMREAKGNLETAYSWTFIKDEYEP